MQSHAVEKYLAELGLLRKPGTLYCARLVLLEYLPHANSADIRGGVMDYLAACRSRGNGSRTLAQKATRLQAFYRSIGVELRLPKIRWPQKSPTAFTPAESDALLRSAGQHRRTIQLMLQSGLRATEMCSLRFADIDRRGVTVRGNVAKNYRERTVPLTAARVAQFDAAESMLVLGGKNRNWLGRMVERVGKKAKLSRHVHPHLFRSTFATRLLQAGIDVLTVSKLLGHSQLTITMRYLAALPDEALHARITRVWA